MDAESHSSQGQSSPSNHAGPAIWFYRDVQGNEQGPFASSCMRSWYEQGYFAADQLIRGCGAEIQPLHQLWERPEEALCVHSTRESPLFRRNRACDLIFQRDRQRCGDGASPKRPVCHSHTPHPQLPT